MELERETENDHKEIIAAKDKGRRIMFQSPSSRASSLFKRSAANPILAPTSRWWESEAVFNPGVIEDKEGNIHILYRAIGRDGISRFGYARTRDGETIEFRSQEPVFDADDGNEFEQKGVEDPRIVCIGGVYHITYTAASVYASGETVPPWLASEPRPWRVRISLAVTSDFKNFTRYGVILPDMDNKDAVLFPEKINGQYAILHRLPPDIWIAYSSNLRDWEEHKKVTHTRPGEWDERRIGAGAPPLLTSKGWLLLYHGADHHNVYRAGFLLLDREDPSRVLGRSPIPAIEPVESYEKEGLVPRVVFPEGLVLRGSDELLMYYGGGDKVVGVAKASLKAVLASLK